MEMSLEGDHLVGAMEILEEQLACLEEQRKLTLEIRADYFNAQKHIAKPTETATSDEMERVVMPAAGSLKRVTAGIVLHIHKEKLD